MEYLQYFKKRRKLWLNTILSFKPCYKWNTFNTENGKNARRSCTYVLNLVISGILSILLKSILGVKWTKVLNLVISGIPSILPDKVLKMLKDLPRVLNLVISGIPSIQIWVWRERDWFNRFKPCYKWNTFNTVMT